MKKIAAVILCVLLLAALGGCKKAESGGSGRVRAWAEGGEARAESVLPDMDAFIEAHNKAAETLGGHLIDPDKLEPLAWGEKPPVEGGFFYDGYTNGYASGVLMFDPNYIRVTGRGGGEGISLLEYGAIAAAAAGGDPDEALLAMTEMMLSLEPDTFTNGYEVELGETEYNGISFSVEVGKDTGLVQFWVNREGLTESLENGG